MESKPDYLFLTFIQFVRHVCCKNQYGDKMGSAIVGRFLACQSDGYIKRGLQVPIPLESMKISLLEIHSVE